MCVRRSRTVDVVCGRAGQEGQPCPAAPLWSASATADPAQIIVTINAQKTRFNPFLVSAVPSCSLDLCLARPVGHRQPPTNGSTTRPGEQRRINIGPEEKRPNESLCLSLRSISGNFFFLLKLNVCFHLCLYIPLVRSLTR